MKQIPFRLPTTFCALILLVLGYTANAQSPVDLSQFDQGKDIHATVDNDHLHITWETGKASQGQMDINLKKGEPLFNQIQLQKENGGFQTIAENLDPVFILTVGERDLKPRTGWTIFFDNPWQRPYKTFRAQLMKEKTTVISKGSRIHIRISSIIAGSFSGDVVITLFNGTPLIKISAVMSTALQSAAIVYDAGLIKTTPWDHDKWNNINPWDSLFWSDPLGEPNAVTRMSDPMRSTKVAVKYRTIVAQSKGGAIALFPPPHQYFFPEDNCYNLKFNWYGRNYKDLVPEFGIGIRQELDGDKRFVPWFNAPPETQQHLSFFCLLSLKDGPLTLAQVKQYTHSDKYKALPGYHTFASHYHIEPEEDILKGKPLPAVTEFVKAFKESGVDIVHLASFHGVGHPEGPDSIRLLELKTSYDLCRDMSDHRFLLLPGEEPNHFFGGHWIDLFAHPVYWIMKRNQEQPFVEADPTYGKVYHVGSKEDMLQLLQKENGLAWASHPRIKGSVGYPDQYKKEPFYLSKHFLGAAWKAMPADLSMPILGKRALNLLSDMANWGDRKYMLGEGDLFKILPEYELYGHLNINYLQLEDIPSFDHGWQSVLDALSAGRFFVTTGEILLPQFSVNGKKAGQTVKLDPSGHAEIALQIDWTFPLNFVDIVSGDGQQVYHQKIDLSDTKAFGNRKFTFPVKLKHCKWVRIEVWDAAVNGAFSQPVWIHGD